MSLLTGILGLLMLGYGTYYAPKTPQGKILRTFGVIALLLSPGLAWLETHRELISAQSDIKKARLDLERLTKPKLRAEITHVGIGGRARGLSGENLTVFLRVTNTGAPSIVANWKIVVITRDGREAEALPFVSGPQMQTITLEREDGGIPVVVSPDDDLAAKTSQDPIPNGGARFGYLITILRNIDTRSIQRIRLSFVDVTGLAYQIDHDISGEDMPPDRTPYLPGLRRPADRR